eukprot:2078548-Pleurochrysis_carterae.AAC.2
MRQTTIAKGQRTTKDGTCHTDISSLLIQLHHVKTRTCGVAEVWVSVCGGAGAYRSPPPQLPPAATLQAHPFAPGVCAAPTACAAATAFDAPMPRPSPLTPRPPGRVET